MRCLPSAGDGCTHQSDMALHLCRSWTTQRVLKVKKLWLPLKRQTQHLYKRFDSLAQRLKPPHDAI